MSGQFAGTAQLIKEKCPNAHYVHCLAHCVNLAAGDACKGSVLIRDAVDFTHKLVGYIRVSGRRRDLFQSIQDDSEITTNTNAPVRSALRPLCPTRWTVRGESLRSVLLNYSILLATLQELCIANDITGEARITAKGLLTYLNNADTYFKILSSERIFIISDSLATQLQKVSINISDALRYKSAICEDLRMLRDQFDQMFERTERATQELDLSPLELPRARKIPRRIDDGTEAFNPPDLKTHYRLMFIEAVELIFNAIDSRINNESLAPALCIETLIETSLKTAPASNDLFQTVSKYHPSIDIDRLQSELFPSIPTDAESLPSLISWFQSSQTRQTAYSETFKTLSLFSVIPVTTATCERSFSCLRRLKNYLRSTIGQERLNSVLLCAIHTDLVDGLNLEELANDFIEINDARLKYYGRFKHNI